ncbi:PAS domain S-box protein [Chloroflexota bacterium]
MDKTAEKERRRKILDVIAKVARGDYSTRIDFSRDLSSDNDELDALSAGLNMMINEISQRNKDLTEQGEELQLLNVHLQKAVTERKRAEVLYKTLAKSSPAGIYIIQNSRLKFVNPQFQKYTGYTEAELLDTNPLDIVHPEDKEIVKQGATAMLKGSRHLPYEFRVITRTGETLWAMETVTYCEYNEERAGLGNFMDITERKRAEEALKVSEEKWSSLVESAPNIIMLVSLDKKIQYINYVVPGLTMESVIGKSIFDYIQPEYHETVREVIDKVFQTGETSIYETMGTGPDGRTSWYGTTVGPLKIDGQITGAIQITSDITELKQTEEALRESEEKFRTFMKTASDLMNVTDKDGKFTYVNDSMIRTLGYSKEELIGMHITQILTKESLEKNFKPNWGKFLANGEISLETTFLTKEGKEIYCEMKAVAIYDSDGNYVGTGGVHHNITERKQTEEAIKESEEKFSKIFYANPNPMIILSAESIQITDVNEAFIKHSGYSREECIGKKPEDLNLWVHPEEREKLKQVTAEQGRVNNFETEMRIKSGEIRTISLSSELVSMAGKPYLITTTVDITERIRNRLELQEKNDRLDAQNEELQAQQQELIEKTREVERANQLKSEFLAGMSHELRTPLNAVIGFSELMLDGITGEINDEQKECLNDILGSGQHLLELINDVLDLSKVEAGKMEFKPENLNMTDVINEAVQTVKPMLNEKGHSMEINVEKELPQIYADKSRLRQVLLNLLSNSSKFTPRNGRLRIEAGIEDNFCQVSVIDNGIGIKKADQERIFEVFTQAETIQEETKKGTGLGLTITRQFIEAMGGSIWLESEFGKSSQFIFTLPLVKEGKTLPEKKVKEKAARKEEVRPKPGQRQVLIVDDDSKARRLLRIWLREEGFDVIEATDAEEGLKQADELLPDVIFLDILMPEKDGWYVLRELKSRSKTREIPVVMTSVSEERELAFSLGAVDYFVKPIDKKRFLKRIAELGIDGQGKILVVDDNPTDVRLVASILETVNIGVLRAYGGEEGVRKAREDKPVLIVLDILMPDLNGFQVIEKLHEDENTRNIPIIVLTSKDLSKVELDMLTQQTRAILIKSKFSREDFISEVKKVVSMDSI